MKQATRDTKQQSQKAQKGDQKKETGTNKIAGFFKGAFQDIKDAFSIENKKTTSNIEERKSS